MFESPATSVYNCNIDQRSRYREIAHRSRDCTSLERTENRVPNTESGPGRRATDLPSTPPYPARCTETVRAVTGEVTHAANATVRMRARRNLVHTAS